MNERFVVEDIKDSGSESDFRVVDTVDGWFFPTFTEVEAKFLCEQLNKLAGKNSNGTIEEYFQEWEQSIEELSHKEKKQFVLKETYNQLEQEIVDNTDFKELYGANNQKVRDAHVKNELKDLVDEKQDIHLRIEYLKRRIEFIKGLMDMQKTLIYSGVLE